jgi:uncharacterized membrane protein (UPF0127 family)
VLCGAAFAACERNEPDRGAATAAAHHPESPKAETPPGPAPAATAKNHCVVPLASEAPPRAARAPSCPKDPTGPPRLPRGWASFPDAPGEPRVAIEIANTPPSRERGLMYRTEMPEDQGMIFTWADEAERSFWMHDTCIPLDMLYIARDGVIEGVLEQVPAMDETPRAVPCPALHVLEVNAGWTRAHGIAPGQRVHIES